MKRIAIASVLAALSSGTVLAADMAARMPMKAAPMMAPVSSWQGFYIGGNVGYGWGNGKTDFSFLPDPVNFGTPNTTLDAKGKGVTGGMQIGYNWQMGSLVAGVETDVQGSGINGSAIRGPLLSGAFLSPGSFLTTSEKLTWFGTVRGRLGATVTPDLLLYATAGLAYGEAENSAHTHFVGFDYAGSVNKTKLGWTAGAGAEWMLARNWSAKLEYLYLDLSTVSAIESPTPAVPGFSIGNTWHTQDHIVRAGANYHF